MNVQNQALDKGDKCRNEDVSCNKSSPVCTLNKPVSLERASHARSFRWSRKHERLQQPETRPSRVTKSNSRKITLARIDDRGRGLSPERDDSVKQPPLTSTPPSQISRAKDSIDCEDLTIKLSSWQYLEPDDFDQFLRPNISRNEIEVGKDPTGNNVIDQHFSNSHVPSGSSRCAYPSSVLAGPMCLDQDRSFSINPTLGSSRPAYPEDTLPIDLETESDQSEIAAARIDDTSLGGASYLHTFYRMSFANGLHTLHDTDLIGYYFTHVCRILSCFDNVINPFRKLVQDQWSSSMTLSLTVQSLAIGHIANSYPYMSALGIQKRTQAWQSLQRDLRLYRLGQTRLETALLSLLLLGLSSGWHDSSHVGLQYLYICRDLMQTHLQMAAFFPLAHALADPDFYVNAMLYWEMLTSFIDPVPITPFNGHGMPKLEVPQRSIPVMPHPCTGVAPEIHFAMAEIGRIMRRKKLSRSVSSPSSTQDPTVEEQDRIWTTTLKRFIEKVRVPQEEDIVDYGDLLTPRSHLTLSAEAYRFGALLEIYRLYPDLYDNSGSSGSAEASDVGECKLRALDQRLTYPDLTDHIGASLAITTLDILDGIALSSGACCMQPLLLLSAACQLRFGDEVPASGAVGDGHQDCIVSYRYRAEHRILALSRKMPQRPLLRVMEIVHEVWSRWDHGEKGVHWMDVVDDNGWQTFFR